MLLKKQFLPAYFLTFVNVLGFSILIPVLPFIVKDYGAPEFVYGLLISLYSFFQYLGAPILGKLSDRIGRKPVLLVSQAGTLLSWLVFGLAFYLPESNFLYMALPLWIIAFARTLDGITGGNNSVTNAYISDLTSPEEKKVVFGYLGGLAGIGIIIGPGLGGLASSSSLGYLGVVLLAAVISLITLFVIQFFVKETISSKTKVEKKRASLLEVFWIPTKIKKLAPSNFIKTVFSLQVFMRTTMACYIGTIALFVIDVFDFNAKQMGFFMLAVGGFLFFNQAFIYGRVVKKIGEIKTLSLGFLLMALGFVSITLTKDLWLYIVLYYILNLGISLSIPVFNSLISQKAAANKQGEAMGIAESIGSLCNAIFPILAALLYSYLGYSFYYVLALIPLLGFVFCLSLAKNSSSN